MSDNMDLVPQRRAQPDPDTVPMLDSRGEQMTMRAAPVNPRVPSGMILTVVIGLIIPMVLICLVALERHGFVSRLHHELIARHVTLGIVHRIDQEFARLIAIGQTLATSPTIAAADLAGFRQQAAQVHTQDGVEITLSGPTGQLLVDTRSPDNAVSPFDGAATIQELVKARRPLVTAPAQVDGQSVPVFAILVPIFLPGTQELTRLLALHGSVSRLQSLLDAPETIGATASLIDDRGKIIAHAKVLTGQVSRSEQIRSFERTVGDWSLWSTKDAAGEPLFLSYGRSDVTGWLVRLDFPGSVLQRHQNRFTRDFLILVALLLLVSLSLCVWAIRYLWRRTFPCGNSQTSAIERPHHSHYTL